MGERDRFERAAACFLQAAALPTTQVAPFLDQACAGDPELRRDVERMLGARDQESVFSSLARGLSPMHDRMRADVASAPTLVGPDDAAIAPGEQQGDRIGKYVLLEPIGEGGFGRVWVAEQREPVRRRVALKVIKVGLDTRQVVARFDAERQALALMDHPGIAKVLDAGATATGRPYFVMELCKGDDIAAYCDRSSLGIPQRLELFAQVCAAVQHAHAKGVIHRDIKPANVLVADVDGHPTPRVIDFGIAKAIDSRLTEQTLYTQHRQLIGTPEYMSPEQAEGSLDIDTRSDVYSLGVLLYELLTGSTPLSRQQVRSASHAEMQRLIREVDPPKPSTRLGQSADTIAAIAAKRNTQPERLGTLLRGELDWIVMKAMEKDRIRRYDTASALADDVRRYLAGEPISAAPPSVAYRARKLIARNRGLAATVALVALALVLGLVGTGLGLIDANSERERAQAAGEREADARHIAEERLAEAEAAVEFLDSMLGAVDPLAQGRDVTVRQVLDKSAASIDDRFASRPLVAARLQGTIGRTYLNLGALQQAEAPLRRQVELRTASLGPDDRDTRRAVNDLGLWLHAAGRHDEAEAALKQAIETNESLFGRDDAITAESIDALANLYTEQTRFEEAEPLVEESIQAHTRLDGPDSTETLSARNSLAMIYSETGRAEQAEPMFRDLLAAFESSHGPDSLLALDVRGNLAWLLYYRATSNRDADTAARLDEARTLGESIIEDGTRVLGEEHRITLNAMNNLASVYKELDMVDQALDLQIREMEIATRALGENHPDLIVSLANIGNTYRNLGRYEEALPYQQRAIRMAREHLEPDAYGLLLNLAWHGACLRALGRYAEAEPLVLEAHGIALRTLGPDEFITRDLARVLHLIYTAWNEAEPGQGHDAQAAQWQPPE
ncbi:MAG: serine/threonine-protein kinase [Phycisphaerales bacterium]